MKEFLKNHFVPHDGNDYHPHILQKVAMGTMFFLVVLSFITANIQALIWVNVDWMLSAVLPAVVVTKTNTERQEDSLGALTRNATLDRAAQMKAEHMAEKSYFAHYSPDGVSPWYWFGQAGYSFIHAGENLAVHFNDSGEVVKAWMDSPTHRANIMNGVYTEIGIGVAKGEFEGHDTVFVVQFFGTPTVTSVRTIAAVAPAEVGIPIAVPASTQIATQAEIPTVAGLEESVSVAIAQAPVATPIETEEPTEPTEPEESEEVALAPDVPVDFIQLIEETKALALETTQATASATLIAAAPVEEVSVPESRATETLTTSTLAMASIEGGDTISPAAWYSFFTQPLMLLQLLYVSLGSLVLVTLLISMALEWRRHHPLQTVYSGGLIATMALLWYVQTLLIGGAAII